MISRPIMHTAAQNVSSVLAFSAMLAILAIVATFVVPPVAFSRAESPASNFASPRPEDALAGEETKPCPEDGDARVTTDCDSNDARFTLEMLPLGPRSALITRAREESMEILHSQNPCSAWFQEANPEALEVLRRCTTSSTTTEPLSSTACITILERSFSNTPGVLARPRIPAPIP